MSTPRHSEAAFEAHLPANSYMVGDRDGFDRERAIFPEISLAFICQTRPKEWPNLDALRATTECTIALLEEHRAALVAAAVTGQLPIATEPAPQDTAAAVV